MVSFSLTTRFALFLSWNDKQLFLILGDNLHVSPLDRSYKGKVLAHYPENISSNPFDEHAVCMVSS